MVVRDDVETHRLADRNYWVTDGPEDWEDFWDSEPTHEKWRRGRTWR